MPGCGYVTPAGIPTYELLLKDVELHRDLAHPPARATPAPAQTGGDASMPKPDKLRRPVISEGATDSDWQYFSDQWKRYKRSTKLTSVSAVDQLWDCCSEDLARAVYDSGVGSHADEETLLAAVKKLAVKSHNDLVNVVTFLSMGQDRAEHANSFAARLKGQAAVCNFVVKCSINTCQNDTSYADKMVSHQLVRGLADVEIQEQVLGHAATTPGLDLAAITKYVEALETGKRSTGLLSQAGSLNRISDYKRGRSNTLPSRVHAPNQTVENQTDPPPGRCGWCGKTGHGAKPSKETRQKECRAFSATCRKCSGVGHFATVCRTKRSAEDQTGQDNVITGSFCTLLLASTKSNSLRTLPHSVYDDFRGWLHRAPSEHPMVDINISLCQQGYEELQVQLPRVTKTSVRKAGMADSGAQMTVAGLNLVHSLGVTKRELIPLSSKVNAANNQGLGLLGGLLITISGTDMHGKLVETQQLCYISSMVHSIYLSREACLSLGIIGEYFPRIGEHSTKPSHVNTVEADSGQKPECARGQPCSCPPRTQPPEAPSSLPFPATPDNREKLKSWIEEKYADSAFNQCCNQPLPIMTDSPPMKLFVTPGAKAVAVHTPVSIPLHWQEQVKAEIDRDVRLGVLEPVPIGTPTTWCSRMVVCPKKDGSPRRTVDLQALNRAAVRQTHATDPPFQQAASIPKNSFKTVLDCWNGFHSVPLAEEDRHYTTFITPWGRYRYCAAPQGFLAAGDAYTARLYKLTEQFKDKKECIDDACLYSSTLEQNFLSTCEYLTVCGGAGIIFNKKKFQFGSKQVEYLGFTITDDSVKPSDDYIEAIKDFPDPRDITGVRSWFGLVNQVNYAFSLTNIMAPFRNLLKPSTEFVWTPDLHEAFKKSKEMIIEAVKDGVKTFDLGRRTCLATDWSKQGVGFACCRRTVAVVI